MLKALRDDGFKVTLYERRSKVGGLWAYSDNTDYTTALPCRYRLWLPAPAHESCDQSDGILTGKHRYVGQHKQVHMWLLRLPNA